MKALHGLPKTMGSVSCKNLDEVTVAEVQESVAKLGTAYVKYLDLIEAKHLDGAVLDLIDDENQFISMLQQDYQVSSFTEQSQLSIQWRNTKNIQAKRQKTMVSLTKKQTAAKLTDTERFVALAEVPKPAPENNPKPFIGADWLEATAASLLKQKDKEDGNDRALPHVFVRCSRGGKTRAIKELINTIEDQVRCLYISFNNDTPFLLQPYFDHLSMAHDCPMTVDQHL